MSKNKLKYYFDLFQQQYAPVLARAHDDLLDQNDLNKLTGFLKKFDDEDANRAWVLAMLLHTPEESDIHQKMMKLYRQDIEDEVALRPFETESHKYKKDLFFDELHQLAKGKPNLYQTLKYIYEDAVNNINLEHQAFDISLKAIENMMGYPLGGRPFKPKLLEDKRDQKLHLEPRGVQKENPKGTVAQLFTIEMDFVEQFFQAYKKWEARVSNSKVTGLLLPKGHQRFNAAEKFCLHVALFKYCSEDTIGYNKARDYITEVYDGLYKHSPQARWALESLQDQVSDYLNGQPSRQKEFASIVEQERYELDHRLTAQKQYNHGVAPCAVPIFDDKDFSKEAFKERLQWFHQEDSQQFMDHNSFLIAAFQSHANVDNLVDDVAKEDEFALWIHAYKHAKGNTVTCLRAENFVQALVEAIHDPDIVENAEDRDLILEKISSCIHDDYDDSNLQDFMLEVRNWQKAQNFIDFAKRDQNIRNDLG